jgi:hypothetical protein
MITACLLVMTTIDTYADGDETLGFPSIGIASGTDFVGAGVGLRGVTSGTINVSVPGAVRQALLYWTGEAFAPSLGDDTAKLNGTNITGALIGKSMSPDGTRIEYTYRADISDKVSIGANVLLLEEVDFDSKNYGAGVFIIFDDGTTPTPTIDLRDGLDHAYIGQPAPRDETVKQILVFPGINADRTAKLLMMYGDATADRPEEIEIIVGGTDKTILINSMTSSDGAQWDTIDVDINIPAGETELSVQAFSRDSTGISGLPDSLVWNLLAVLIPDVEDEEELCWITGGGFIDLVGDDAAGPKSFTFGGNVGPPPRGSWQIVDHDTGDKFHTNTVNIVSCEVLPDTTGPGQPGGKDGFDKNKANFAGLGTLNGVSGCPFTGFVIDGGEPQGKKSNSNDAFHLETTDEVACAGTFFVDGEMPGGNFQIHPPK